jgi:arabinogalactan oligomer/maltooligosaccharide transport system permease protein
MKVSEVQGRSLVVGLCVALLVALGVGTWLQARSSAGLATLGAERSAVISLRGITEIVERLGLDNEGLQQAVAAYAERDPDVTAVRVIRFTGIRLMASTAPDDVAERAAPRKMEREEKPIYDLGQSLRAAVETNLQEGRAWKQEIDIQKVDSGGLSLAGPVSENEKITGAVLLETAPAGAAAGASWLPALGVLVLAALVLIALLPLTGDRLWVALLLAALIAVGAIYIHGVLGIRALYGARMEAEETLSQRLGEVGEAVHATLAESGVALEPPLEPAAWDTDLFRQPRGLVTESGVRREEVENRLVADRAAYRNLMIPALLLALLLLAFVGLGSAARSGAALLRYRQAYFYVMPALVGMILLVFFPFSYGVLLSFTNSNVYNTDQPIHQIWIGVTNFVDILTDIQIVKSTPEGRVFNYQNFYWTLGFTVIWTITNVAIGVSVGLLLALILNTRGLVLKPMYRVLLILPWAMPNYITALIWKGMFHSQFGVINQVIQMLGGEARSWFDTPFTAFITVLSTNGWLSFPFMMVIALGALQSIPGDLYEAARVDGASRWQQFRTITLPSLKPALVPAIILSVIWTFNQFNVIYLVSQGEPGHATEILITEAYKLAFEQYRYGYAAAYSVVIFLILLAYGVWQNRVTRATEGI